MEDGERMCIFRQLRPASADAGGPRALRFMTRRSVPGSVSFGIYTPASQRLETPWPPTGHQER